jgi:hypothetical protein
VTTDCTCFPVPEGQQTRYGNATEPGSAWEYNPECPEHGEGSPERPQGNPKGVIPSAEAPEPPSDALSPVSVAFPDVRLLADGRVAWHLSAEHTELAWLSTSISGRPYWFTAGELPLDEADRMVPLRPLLALLVELDAAAGRHGEQAGVYRHVANARADVAREFAGKVRRVLASLLGISSDSLVRQGGEG